MMTINTQFYTKYLKNRSRVVRVRHHTFFVSYFPFLCFTFYFTLFDGLKVEMVFFVVVLSSVDTQNKSVHKYNRAVWDAKRLQNAAKKRRNTFILFKVW